MNLSREGRTNIGAMTVQRVRCVLAVSGGPSRRVGPGGTLIGRQADCDIVTADPSASRRHALVRLTADGAEVVPLGRAPIEIDRKLVDRPTPLADGTRLGVPGLELVVELAMQRPDPNAIAGWRLERPRGGSFGIAHTPFVIGGDATDDLIVKRWPAHALYVHVAGGELFVEVKVGRATKNGVMIETDTMEPLGANDELVYRKDTFVVRQPALREATTMAAGMFALPSKITIEMLPRGGRVVFTMHDGDRKVVLADRRLDLMIALVRPPEGYAGGDFIPDDIVRAIVWPRNPGVSRPEINTLISRCRNDLVAAGLSGPRLLERAPGGGGTRLALAPGAVIVVDS